MDPVAVVLAGGTSRRYGSDKLVAEVDGVPMLDRAIAGLDPERRVIIVGPVRPVSRPVEFVADDHPQGGPAAAMITGLRAALTAGAELIMVLPGDAPGGGVAAESLLARLSAESGKSGVVAIARDGRKQPLLLALRRSVAERVITAAGPDGGSGRSARSMIDPLGLEGVLLGDACTWDIDTPHQRRAWLWRTSPAVRMIDAAISSRTPESVIVIGAQPDDVMALARAVALFRDGVIVDSAAEIADDRVTVTLRAPSGNGAASGNGVAGRPLVVGIRETGRAPAFGQVDLWVARPADA